MVALPSWTSECMFVSARSSPVSIFQASTAVLREDLPLPLPRAGGTANLGPLQRLPGFWFNGRVSGWSPFLPAGPGEFLDGAMATWAVCSFLWSIENPLIS